jgi:hypothetical protein
MNAYTVTYNRFFDKYGNPYDVEKINDEELDSLRNHLPDTFIEYILGKFGSSKIKNGYFQFCSPKKYQPVIEEVFKGDRDFKSSRTHAIGFSSCGRILACNEDYKELKIDILDGRILCSEFFNPTKVSPDIALEIAVKNVDSKANDPSDEDGKPMFKRLLKKHGELKVGQIYAPILHPAMGGPFTVDNFRPADALVAMSIAAQSTSFTLYNASIPSVPAVRRIGQ